MVSFVRALLSSTLESLQGEDWVLTSWEPFLGTIQDVVEIDGSYEVILAIEPSC